MSDDLTRIGDAADSFLKDLRKDRGTIPRNRADVPPDRIINVSGGGTENLDTHTTIDRAADMDDINTDELDDDPQDRAKLLDYLLNWDSKKLDAATITASHYRNSIVTHWGQTYRSNEKARPQDAALYEQAGLPTEAVRGVLHVVPENAQGEEVDLEMSFASMRTDNGRVWVDARELSDQLRIAKDEGFTVLGEHVVGELYDVIESHEKGNE